MGRLRASRFTNPRKPIRPQGLDLDSDPRSVVDKGPRCRLLAENGVRVAVELHFIPVACCDAKALVVSVLAGLTEQQAHEVRDGKLCRAAFHLPDAPAGSGGCKCRAAALFLQLRDPRHQAYISFVTALVDWRDDANMPARTFGWPAWLITVALALVAAGALAVAFTRSALDVTDNACRMREGSQGVPYLATSGVAVGQQLPPGWSPGPHIKVRYADGYSPSGLVVDASTCLSGNPDQLTVVVAR